MPSQKKLRGSHQREQQKLPQTTLLNNTKERISNMPTHSVGSAQVKEDRQRAASYSAHFPPPVLREIRYRKRTGKDGL